MILTPLFRMAVAHALVVADEKFDRAMLGGLQWSFLEENYWVIDEEQAAVWLEESSPLCEVGDSWRDESGQAWVSDQRIKEYRTLFCLDQGLEFLKAFDLSTAEKYELLEEQEPGISSGSSTISEQRALAILNRSAEFEGTPRREHLQKK